MKHPVKMIVVVMVTMAISLIVAQCGFVASAPPSASIPTLQTLIFDNLKVILEYGGLPAVILLFGYLYLNSMTKEMTRQLGQMQEQLNNQQIAMNVLIQNNTRALTRLGTAMMMGCPFIRGHLDPATLSLGEDGDDGTKEGAVKGTGKG